MRARPSYLRFGTGVHHIYGSPKGLVPHGDFAEDNERIRWIQNDKLPPRLELRDYFHAFETELNRNEMIGYVMATLHMLHITDIISPQYQQSMFKRRRPQGEATMRDVAPKMELCSALHWTPAKGSLTLR